MSKEKRDYIFYLEDILDALKKIEYYTKNISFEEFTNNDMIVDAVIREDCRMEIIKPTFMRWLDLRIYHIQSRIVKKKYNSQGQINRFPLSRE
ncbi:unnamed protein product [marine sediment metagenome]|uniref:Uncharacterized protein n=1 Tax=marine sediment metagenome TaxID=412755 RepID=X1VBX1_9ZZZZ